MFRWNLKSKSRVYRENQLYLAVALIKIDLEVMDAGLAEQFGSVQHLVSRSNISIADIFRTGQGI